MNYLSVIIFSSSSLCPLGTIGDEEDCTFSSTAFWVVLLSALSDDGNKLSEVEDWLVITEIHVVIENNGEF